MIPSVRTSPAGRVPRVSLGILVLALAAMIEPSLGDALQWTRGAGGWFAGWASHAAHWSWNHFFWDAAVFLPLAWILETRFKKEFLWTLALAVPLLIAAVRFGCPGLASYRGLSGLDSALYGLSAVLLLKHVLLRKDWAGAGVAGGLLLGFALKTFWEIHSGRAFFVDGGSAMVPVPLAHAAGFSIGTLIGALTATQGAGLFSFIAQGPILNRHWQDDD